MLWQGRTGTASARRGRRVVRSVLPHRRFADRGRFLALRSLVPVAVTWILTAPSGSLGFCIPRPPANRGPRTRQVVFTLADPLPAPQRGGRSAVPRPPATPPPRC